MPAGIVSILEWEPQLESLKLREREEGLREAPQANSTVTVVSFGIEPPEGEVLEASSELDHGLDDALGNAFRDVKDVKHAKLSSGNHAIPQCRPEGRSQERFIALTDPDPGQVRSDGSDELSKVRCVEVAAVNVAETGALLVAEEQLAHRPGMRVSPGDDPRGADDRRTPGAPFHRCGVLFSRKSHVWSGEASRER
jgi:hypothetical protein